ncbi:MULTISPECIES: hypothetical protein [Bacillus cereus group]|uniref:Uncharacterized protein n=1 Tax=Bacillus thuringiensis TaxID=1428 RepID=A0A9X7FXY3_BACTU|nr:MULTISPECIES: hypothetical protein [Bacillus cereus group]PFT50862.1 hypothetical protein COK72_02315 [Bacillus thuringiensis]PFY22899.1 hypothetical protein COL44_18635 [Bacillus toyonensis]
MTVKIEEIMKKINYELEKLRVSHYRAVEPSPHLSEESGLSVCLTVLRHHKNQVIIEMEKLEDDLIERINRISK